MLAYGNFSFSSSRSNFVSPRRKRFYDKIVDRSLYRPDAEDVRNQKLKAGQSSAGDVGLYDYQDGKVNKRLEPSPIMIALRQGQLDKADIQKIKSVLADDLDKATKDYNDAKALEDAQAAATASQEKLNSVLDSVKV